MNKQARTPDFFHRKDEWAVILAGGDGSRLKSLTRKIAGDERPKQFCSVLGKASLLEQTSKRTALELATARTLYVLNRMHEPYYRPVFEGLSTDNLVLQPANCGTAPAILYSLLRMAVIDPQALAAFLPSDHYISDDERFMSHIRVALDTARSRRDLIILLGLDPESPEVEYGWIEPGEALAAEPRVCGVRRFWEKPNQLLAQVLQLRGCLWNSFVMVASVQALLEMIETTVPQLHRSFLRISPLLGTSGEGNAVDELYQALGEINFSHEVLALCPERLAVLKVTGVKWNDLGEPKRVMASLDMAGIRPHWLESGVPQFA